MNKAQLIDRAEEILGISFVESDSGRLAYFATETSEWYWVSDEDLEYALDVEGEDEAYSLWCASTGELVEGSPEDHGLA